MAETDLTHAVPSHKPTFIYVRVNTIDAPLGRVLPDDIVVVIGKNGLVV